MPHITDAIQDWIEEVAKVPVDGKEGSPDVCVIELGGTVGDIESSPFVEALRQVFCPDALQTSRQTPPANFSWKSLAISCLALMQALELPCRLEMPCLRHQCSYCSPFTAQPCSTVLWVLVCRYAPPANISALSNRPVQVAVAIVLGFEPPSPHVSDPVMTPSKGQHSSQICQYLLVSSIGSASKSRL